MRLWDPFDLHNSRPATAAVIWHAIGRIFFSELSLADYNKIMLNLQFLPTNRGPIGRRRGSEIVAFIKIDIRMCVCVCVQYVCGTVFYPIFHLCGRCFDFEAPRKPTAADRYWAR